MLPFTAFPTHVLTCVKLLAQLRYDDVLATKSSAKTREFATLAICLERRRHFARREIHRWRTLRNRGLETATLLFPGIFETGIELEKKLTT